MRLRFANPETGDEFLNIELLPSQEEFWKAKERYVLFSGGVGCVRGDTKVLTNKGCVAIKDLQAPFYVLSHRGRWCPVSKVEKYQPSDLVEIVTRTGSFVATPEHLVYTEKKWCRVKNLKVGMSLSNPDVSDLLVHVSGVQRCWQTTVNYLKGCFAYLRQYGVRLRLGIKTFLNGSPLLAYVPAHTHHDSVADGQATAPKHTQIYQSFDHRSTKDFLLPSLLPAVSETNHISSTTSAHAFVLDQLPSLFRSMTFQGVVGVVQYIFFVMFRQVYALAYANPTEIVAIKPVDKEEYYDLDVANDHSYIANGFVHHNCGKSMTMLLKCIYDCMSQDNNYFLIGRSTYGEIHDVLIKEFFELCPDYWIKSYKKTPHPSVILNTFSGKTSEIIFRNLDKMSKGELLGLNLGGFAIDQAEDIPEEIFNTLKGRLRRKNIDHRVYMTSNPKLSWLYRAFKQQPENNYRLIEGSTLENEKNLPSEYIEDLKNYPTSWYNQYVLGIWDESLLSDNIVFAREHIEKLAKNVRPPKKTIEGLNVYEEYTSDCEYQIGIDSAEGAETTEDTMRKTQKDNAVIVIWNLTKNTEAAMYSGKIPPRVLAEKAVRFAKLYGEPMIVPEMNSMGAALLQKLQDLDYTNIYRRTEYDRVLKKQLKKLGFRTTSSSKMLLISHFDELLRLTDVVVRSRETVEELKTFVYTDNAKKKGAAAQQGFHDDKVMATLLACFNPDGVKKSGLHKESYATLAGVETVPTLNIVNGRIRPPQGERNVSWKVL